MEQSGGKQQQEFSLQGAAAAQALLSNGKRLRKCTRCDEYLREEQWIAGHDCIDYFKQVVAELRHELNQLQQQSQQTMKRDSVMEEEVNLTELSEEEHIANKKGRRVASKRNHQPEVSPQLSPFRGGGVPDIVKSVRAMMAKSPPSKKSNPIEQQQTISTMSDLYQQIFKVKDQEAKMRNKMVNQNQLKFEKIPLLQLLTSKKVKNSRYINKGQYFIWNQETKSMICGIHKMRMQKREGIDGYQRTCNFCDCNLGGPLVFWQCISCKNGGMDVCKNCVDDESNYIQYQPVTQVRGPFQNFNQSGYNFDNE